MAEHAHTTTQKSPPLTVVTSRRIAVVTALLVLSGAAAARATELRAGAKFHPDAELLALRPRFDAALREMSVVEMLEPPPGISAVSRALEERLSKAGEELDEVCWAIVECSPPQTVEGRALKAAAAMHHLRIAFDGNGGFWPGSGEAMAWDVLSEIAGEVYTPITRPADMAHTEPERV